MPIGTRIGSADRTRKRSPRDRERQVRRTRTEGARRAIRARRATDVGDDARALARPRERLGQRSFPGAGRVARLAERVRRLSRSEASRPGTGD
jgi:hypothetical protein